MEGIGGLGLTGSSIGEAGGKTPAPLSSNTKAANTVATRIHGDSTVGTSESETPEVNAPCLHNNIIQGLILAAVIIADASGGEIRRVPLFLVFSNRFIFYYQSQT